MHRNKFVIINNDNIIVLSLNWKVWIIINEYEWNCYKVQLLPIIIFFRNRNCLLNRNHLRKLTFIRKNKKQTIKSNKRNIIINLKIKEATYWHYYNEIINNKYWILPQDQGENSSPGGTNEYLYFIYVLHYITYIIYFITYIFILYLYYIYVLHYIIYIIYFITYILLLHN